MHCLSIQELIDGESTCTGVGLAVAAYAGLISQDDFLDTISAVDQDAARALENLRSSEHDYFRHILKQTYVALAKYDDPEFRRTHLSRFVRPYVQFLLKTFGTTHKTLEEIAVAYDDFGFPEEIEPLVYFMPCHEKASLGSEDSIFRRIETYLAQD